MSTVAQHPSSPSKMIVSLQLAGPFFALANIICVAILCYSWLAVHLEPKTLIVTGSAKKQITSDLITWSATLTTTSPELTQAYDKLKSDADRTRAFLEKTGLPPSTITFSQISTEKHFVKEQIPQPAVNGQPQPPQLVDSDKIKSYTLTQTVTVSSTDMKTVPQAARDVTSLIKDGVEIDSCSPQYLYTKLSELKINMLAEATKDATARATQIVTNANGNLGKLVEAKMGVIQINPKGSSATSAEGNNDTSSYEKEITAIVTARYELR